MVSPDTNDDVVHAHVLYPNGADHVADAHVADAPVFDTNADVANVITMFQPTIVTDLESMIYSVAGLVAEVITGVEVSINTATAGGHDQVGNNNELRRITVDQPTEPEPEDVSLLTRKLVLALLTVGITTMATDISTVLHMSANGVVFGHNKLAFLILGGIFAAGAIEVIIAVWLARSGAPDGRSRRFSFVRAAICVSIVPFVAVVGIKSTVVMEG